MILNKWNDHYMLHYFLFVYHICSFLSHFLFLSLPAIQSFYPFIISFSPLHSISLFLVYQLCYLSLFLLSFSLSYVFLWSHFFYLLLCLSYVFTYMRFVPECLMYKNDISLSLFFFLFFFLFFVHSFDYLFYSYYSMNLPPFFFTSLITSFFFEL